MKRLNPATNKPFKKGETREDGYRFIGYHYGRLKKDGTFIEVWASPENYIKRYKKEAERKQRKRLSGRKIKNEGGGEYRVDPDTGERFVSGDRGKDGRIFVKYDSYINSDGTFAEMWASSYEIYKKMRIRSVTNAIRVRAKKKNLPFDLTSEYLVEIFPDDNICPVLGIRMDFSRDTNRFNSPSVDRIIPDIGYVRGNVVWMAMRANVIKQDAISDEVQKVADWLKKNEG